MTQRRRSKAQGMAEPHATAQPASAVRSRWWMYGIHRPPLPIADRVRAGAPHFEDYDGSFTFFRALAPAVWLALVGMCMLSMLYAVGYLSPDQLPTSPEKVTDALKVTIDISARRAALAYSGVTLAITVALSLTSLVWAVAAFRGKAPAYRWPVLIWVTFVLVLSLTILGWMACHAFEPFASNLGRILLESARSDLSAPMTGRVPDLMFGLACIVPAILAAGGGFLLQPMKDPSDADSAKLQLRLLAGRLNELDQLLYVGALALVFGTLQLSAAMSLPLASMPKAVDLKSQADMCKTLAPSPASSPFFTPGASGSTRGSSFHSGFDAEHCRDLPREFARGEVADGLRQLVRGITLSFGLAFSALLSAIYVPALIGLRLMIAPPQRKVHDAAAAGTKEEKSDIGDVDPLRRVAAVAAPLIAGLLANALATG
jgi:hypothetical protein